MEFIGRFHPLFLHLPIGILLYAFLHWSYERFIAKKEEKTDFTFALSIGAISAITSAVSGWVLAADGGYDEELLNWHKYLGISTAVGSVLLLWMYKKHSTKNLFAIFFTTFILLLTATGHYGGSLTHGEGFLTQSSRKATSTSLENPAEAHIFDDVVMPIVDKKCVSCHNPQKSKGGLLLHNLAGWQAGGDNGSVLQIGLSSESAIIQHIFLTKEEEEHMPPTGKIQLTNDERNFLKWWVDNMEGYEQQVKDLNTNAAVEKYLESLKGSNRPEVDKPSMQQLTNLRDYGLIASLQSIDDPWVDVRLMQTDSFDAQDLMQLRGIAAAVQFIDLSGASITDDDTDFLSRLKNVEHLNLSNCAIGNTTVASLKDLAYLKTLNLYATQIDSNVIGELAVMESLERVYVWGTNITNSQLVQWQQDYPNLEFVQGVDFDQFGSPELVPPVIIADQDLFTDSLLVELETKANRATIRYTVDGSNPTTSSAIYTTPFYVHNTTEVKGILMMDGWTDSEPVSRTFAKSRYTITDLRTNVPPHENYTAEGSATLVDLRKGTNAFADGNWLGFFGDDVVLTADLGELREITGVTIGTLTDFNAYIHLPTFIDISTSQDGQRYTSYQEKTIPVAEGPTEVMVHNHYLSSSPVQARYIRIRLKNQKINPDWHPAPGATCWLFIDEILVE